MNRKRTPEKTATAVLAKCARRCALCFHLDGDLTEKRGQVAHLDKDPSNDAEDNLAFLCLDHHTLFDSRTSQHKNYTAQEVKAARDTLYEAIDQGRHHGRQADLCPEGRLELSFDPDDSSCTRSWPNARHCLYRVRVRNCGKVIAHRVVVKIEQITPPFPDLLGTHLVVRHRPDADSVDLRPEETGYFDLLEFNAGDEVTGGPVLLVWHRVDYLPRQLPVTDYEFLVKAYSDEGSSTALSLCFKHLAQTECPLSQPDR